MSVLFFREMIFHTKNPDNPDNDEFILNKRHAVSILYTAVVRAGCTLKNIITLREFGSSFEGHPLPGTVKWVEVATGSLRQGLSIAVGMALAGQM